MTTMRADLHTHSVHSDGTTSVAENIAAAAAAGLSAIAVTDHDTVAGWADARAAKHHGVHVIPGAELSTQHGGHGVHLLAYGFDPYAPAIQPYITAPDPEARARQFVENLAAAGYNITFERVRSHATGSTVSRPHIARALMDAGHVTSIDEAFQGPLSKTGPHYVEKPAPDTATAIRAVHAARGVAIAGHFLSDLRIPRDHQLSDLDALVTAGLDGVEVFHREHEAATRAELLDYAREHKLIVTGSSDFHGANKENMIGENTTDAQNLRRILDRAAVTRL